MELSQALAQRRSIRRFRPDPIPKEQVRAVLLAAMQAPSAKNRQPWRFVVASGAAKDKALQVMAEGLKREKEGQGLLPHMGGYAAAAFHSLDTMVQAPVIVFILNETASTLHVPADMAEMLFSLSNVQSVGAAIENMLLAAVGQGLGGLWVCDVFFAYRELCAWLKTDRQLIAAVALGVPDEDPPARPRKPFDDVVEWRTE